MKKKILFSLLAALVLSFTATAKAGKTSVKTIVVTEDEFTGSKVYEPKDKSALELEGNNFLGINIVPSISIGDEESSIKLVIEYKLATTDDNFFEKIIFIGGGKKVQMELDTSKMTSRDYEMPMVVMTVKMHSHKCFGKISKEEYDLLKEVFSSTDLKCAAYSTTTGTFQGKPDGKKHMTLFSDLETAALADNPEVAFAENDGVITISAQ